MGSVSKTNIDNAIALWLMGAQGCSSQTTAAVKKMMDCIDQEQWEGIHAKAMKALRRASDLEKDVKERETKLKEREPVVERLLELQDERLRESIRLAYALKELLSDTDSDTVRHISYAVYGYLNGNKQPKSIPVEGEKDYCYPMMNEPEV